MIHLLGFVFIVIAVSVWIGVYLSYRHRELSKLVWALRNDIALIESKLIEEHFGSDAEEFVMHLADLASDESHMREIHKITMNSNRIGEGQIVNVEKVIGRAFNAQASLVMEALTKAAHASYLLGKNPLLHTEFKKKELQKRSFVMFKELTASNFLLDFSDASVRGRTNDKHEKQSLAAI